jgi:hypothetical protein
VTVVVRIEPRDVRSRLAELGLEEEPLQEVVRRGYLAFITCTPNHPRLIPGILAWGETVRALREYTLLLGWRRSDENNYSVVINPPGRIAIAVATGDDGTGCLNAFPSTKAPKGPSTIDAVNANQLRFDFMSPDVAEAQPEPSQQSDDRVTWVLLIHRAQNEVRCEISLPYSMGDDGRIDGWRERIILGALPLDGELTDITPRVLPDITIDVKRRA